jgi:hypothetical protein
MILMVMPLSSFVPVVVNLVVVLIGLSSDQVRSGRRSSRVADGPLTWEWRSFVKLRYPARGWRWWAGHTVQAPPAGVHVYTSPSLSAMFGAAG